MSQAPREAEAMSRDNARSQQTPEAMQAAPASRLDPAWINKMLAGAKRMHEDEPYRLAIARQLS